MVSAAACHPAVWDSAECWGSWNRLNSSQTLTRTLILTRSQKAMPAEENFLLNLILQYLSLLSHQTLIQMVTAVEADCQSLILLNYQTLLSHYRPIQSRMVTAVEVDCHQNYHLILHLNLLNYQTLIQTEIVVEVGCHQNYHLILHLILLNYQTLIQKEIAVEADCHQNYHLTLHLSLLNHQTLIQREIAVEADFPQNHLNLILLNYQTLLSHYRPTQSRMVTAVGVDYRLNYHPILHLNPLNHQTLIRREIVAEADFLQSLLNLSFQNLSRYRPNLTRMVTAVEVDFHQNPHLTRLNYLNHLNQSQNQMVTVAEADCLLNRHLNHLNYLILNRMVTVAVVDFHQSPHLIHLNYPSQSQNQSQKAIVAEADCLLIHHLIHLNYLILIHLIQIRKETAAVVDFHLIRYPNHLTHLNHSRN
nr:hypothetical protein BaRGS_031488 [Batillaria attramentaria]